MAESEQSKAGLMGSTGLAAPMAPIDPILAIF